MNEAKINDLRSSYQNLKEQSDIELKSTKTNY